MTCERTVMRFLAIVLFFLSSVYAFAQMAKSTCEQYPFQVVYAENAKLADGITILGRYNYVSHEAQIVLDSGFLILMHCSGKLFEFKGDSVVQIQSVLKTLPEYLNSVTNERPDISYFVKYQFNFTGALTICSSSHYDVEVVPECVHPEQEFTLKWQFQNSNFHPAPVVIYIKDIYDRIVGEERSEASSFSFRLDKYDLGSTGLAIIQIVNLEHPDLASIPLGIQTQCSYRYFPNFESANSSIDALNAWYYLISNQKYNPARTYLRQAQKLSDHSFYMKLGEIWNTQ